MASHVELVITPRLHDIGGLTVGRILPFVERRMVGPFIFLDHIGPAQMPADQALDVRPHPHIGLSTLTYLYDGAIFHRDNLGNALAITPGAVNWMTAGRGIAHSERTPAEARRAAHRIHGLQCWVALPREAEETAPSFSHHHADAIPSKRDGNVALRVIAGTGYGLRSPVEIFSPLFYIDARLAAGATLPLPDEHEDKAVYVIEGEIEVDGTNVDARRMIVFVPGEKAEIRAITASRVILLGGARFAEPRHIWWNFVSSSKERIEQAKRDWKEGRFARIPGDDTEFIPLPE